MAAPNSTGKVLTNILMIDNKPVTPSEEVIEKCTKSLKLVISGDERTAIIVGAIHVENALRELLVKNLYVPNEKNLFESNGSLLNSFSDKLSLAHAMKLLDDKFYNILDRVRDLRNKCAHDLQLSFDKGSHKDKLKHIGELVNDISLYQESLVVWRNYFLSESKKASVESKTASVESKAMIVALFVYIMAMLEALLFFKTKKNHSNK